MAMSHSVKQTVTLRITRLVRGSETRIPYACSLFRPVGLVDSRTTQLFCAETSRFQDGVSYVGVDNVDLNTLRLAQ
jgi:hypothetical protein